MEGGLLVGDVKQFFSLIAVLSYITPSDLSFYQVKIPKCDLDPVLWHFLLLKIFRVFSFRCLGHQSTDFPYLAQMQQKPWPSAAWMKPGLCGLVLVPAASPTSSSSLMWGDKENRGQRGLLTWTRLQTIPDWKEIEKLLQLDFTFQCKLEVMI